MWVEISLVGMKAQWDEGWWKNTAGRQHRRRGGHATADQVPVLRSLGFNSTAFRMHLHLTTCLPNSDLRRTVLDVVIVWSREHPYGKMSLCTALALKAWIFVTGLEIAFLIKQHLRLEINLNAKCLLALAVGLSILLSVTSTKVKLVL
jgi:hypothetical protein